MSTRKTLTIAAIVFVVGMSGIVMGLPSIPQANAAEPTEPSQYGRCSQATIAYDLYYGRDDPGQELANHREDFCTEKYPHPPAPEE